MLKNNVGSLDRIGRLVIGLVVISLVFEGPKTAWGWIGLVPLGTALLKTCPLYTLFGFSSCPLKK